MKALLASLGQEEASLTTKDGQSRDAHLASLRASGLVLLRDGEVPSLVFVSMAREVWRGTQKVSFGRSKLLFGLLEAIALNPGSGRQALYERVWGLPYREDSSHNAFHVSLNRLRARLGDMVTILAHQNGAYEIEGRPRVWVLQDQGSPTISVAPLPSPQGSLVGRGGLLDDLIGRLKAQPGLVVLKGPGGVGKTRLALEAAMRTPGALWLDATDMTTREQIVRAASGCLGFNPKGDEATQIEAIGRALGTLGEGLCVLDNVEQAVGLVAPLLEAWSKVAPQMRWLATTRVPLPTALARTFEVPPLSSVETEALFRDRARDHIDADASLTGLIEALDGLPLAVELAAAQLDVIPLSTLKIRMGKLLEMRGNPGAQGQNPHHRTMRAVVTRSWSLLDLSSKHTLMQCAVFCGAFTFEGAEAVVDITEWTQPGWGGVGLRKLARASLIQTVPRGPEEGYKLYAVVREHALERLGMQPADYARQVRLRHARHFIQELEGRTAMLRNEGLTEALEWFEQASSNLDSAILTALEVGGPLVTRGALAMDLFLEALGRTAQRRALLETTRGALQRNDGQIPLSLDVRWGHTLRHEGDLASATAIQQAVLDEARTQGLRGVEADALRELGNITYAQRRLDEALDHFGRSKAAYLAVGDERTAAIVTGNLATIHSDLGNFDKGELGLRRALAAHRRLGNLRSAAIVLANIGIHHLDKGDFAAARESLQESLAIRECLGNPDSVARLLCTLGMVLHFEGRSEEGLAALRRVRGPLRIHTTHASMAISALNTGAILLQQGDLAAARRSLDDALDAAQVAGVGARSANVLIQLALVDALDDKPSLARHHLDASRAFMGEDPPESFTHTLSLVECAVAVCSAPREHAAERGRALRQQLDALPPHLTHRTEIQMVVRTLQTFLEGLEAPWQR